MMEQKDCSPELGFCVDDDNDNPAPENNPSPSSNDRSHGGCNHKEWNSITLDEGRLCGAIDVKRTLIEGDPTFHTILGYFTHFLPAKELLDYSFQGGGRQRVHAEGFCAATCKEETAPDLRDNGQVPSGQSLQQCTSNMSVRHTTAVTRRIITYCRCKIGFWMCPTTCIGIHIASKENDNGVEQCGFGLSREVRA